jgi:hypothetical protein
MAGIGRPRLVVPRPAGGGGLPPPCAPAPPWSAFQVAGDVVLTVGSGLGGLGNLLAQSAYERRWSRVTHAMLVARPGVYFDVGPATGARFRPAESLPLLLREARADAGRGGRLFVAAFRHPSLARRAELRDALADSLAALEGTPYNFALVLKRRAGGPSAFCSELVATVLAGMGLPVVPGRRASSVLPHTLDLALRRRPWLDVTDAYTRRLGGGAGGTRPFRAEVPPADAAATTGWWPAAWPGRARGSSRPAA